MNLLPIIEKFPGTKILVVGDVMLDRYWWGSVRRISPEAPVPVVNLEKTSLVAGGAANVAANIKGLGAIPVLVGVIGDDEAALSARKILEKSGISPENLLKIAERPTTIKTRIVAHNQHVVRIDLEDSNDLNSDSENEIIQAVEKLSKSVGAIIVSDYAKGVITKNVLTGLITTGKRFGIPVLVDPKGKDYSKYRGATMITPNRSEAATACEMNLDGNESVNKAGRILMEKFGFGSVLITQGEEGMTLFQNGDPPLHLKTTARKVFDVTGAGDTVIAGLGVAVASGASLEDAAEIANIAAGLVVEEVGTTTINLEKLNEAIKDEDEHGQ